MQPRFFIPLFSLSAAVAVLTLIAGEMVARSVVRTSGQEDRSKPASSDNENVIALSGDPFALPPRPSPGQPMVLLVGNSHTYALPGLKRGDFLRESSDETLIYELASRLEAVTDPGQLAPKCYRLADPNLLPVEMLTRVAFLLHHGYKPDLVIVGLTYRNVARDAATRYEIREAYRDSEFATDFPLLLAQSTIGEFPNLVASVNREIAKVEFEIEQERMRSHADQLEQLFAEHLDPHLILLGHSAELRANLYRAMTFKVQSWFAARENREYQYDFIEHDFQLNMDALEAMFRMLSEQGAKIVVYYAPERDDLPPLIDPSGEEQYVDQLDEWSQEMGILVLDARRIVPNDLWGWVGDVPDRSHFTEPGHDKLAHFIFDHLSTDSILTNGKVTEQ